MKKLLIAIFVVAGLSAQGQTIHYPVMRYDSLKPDFFSDMGYDARGDRNMHLRIDTLFMGKTVVIFDSSMIEPVGFEEVEYMEIDDYMKEVGMPIQSVGYLSLSPEDGAWA